MNSTPLNAREADILTDLASRLGQSGCRHIEKNVRRLVEHGIPAVERGLVIEYQAWIYDLLRWFPHLPQDYEADLARMAEAVLVTTYWAEQYERLKQELLAPEKMVKRMGENLQPNITIQHWAVRLLAWSLAQTLGESPNFVVLDVQTLDEVAMSIIIQRKNGKSPADTIHELREENKSLHESVEALTKERDGLQKTIAEYIHDDSQDGAENLHITKEEG